MRKIIEAVVNEEGIRDTFERVAKLVGADLNNTTVCKVSLDGDYFISLSQHGSKNIHMTLVKDHHTGRGWENQRISYEVIKAGDSDKKILNRFDKLKKTYLENK